MHDAPDAKCPGEVSKDWHLTLWFFSILTCLLILIFNFKHYTA